MNRLKDGADLELQLGRQVMQRMRGQHSQMQEFDRSFEKNFKKEFPGLGFNQLESLMKCFK